MRIQAKASSTNFEMYRLASFGFPHDVMHPQMLDATVSTNAMTENATLKSMYQIPEYGAVGVEYWESRAGFGSCTRHAPFKNVFAMTYAKNPVLTRVNIAATMSSPKPTEEKTLAAIAIVRYALIVSWL